MIQLQIMEVGLNIHDPWTGVRGDRRRERDYLNANEIDGETMPTVTAFMANGPTNTGLVKRTAKACKPKTTSKPSCSMQNQDPDQGITSAHCVCNGVTLPLLTPTHVTVATQSCEYTRFQRVGTSRQRHI